MFNQKKYQWGIGKQNKSMFHAEKVCENFDLNHFWGLEIGRYSIKRGFVKRKYRGIKTKTRGLIVRD